MAESPQARGGTDVGRVLLLVIGSIASLVALGLVAAGIGVLVVHGTQRDDDGFYTSPVERFETDAYALVSEGFGVAADATDEEFVDWLVESDVLERVRIRAESAGGDPDIFVGIGPEDDVRAFLDGVAYDEVEGVDVDPFVARYRRFEGTSEPQPPAGEGFWVAQAEGPGQQTVEWEVEDGRWAIVVMNAGASAGVAADADLAVRLSYVVWVGIGLLAAGLLFLGAGILMIVLGARGRPVAAEAGPVVPPAPVAAAAPGEDAYPVAVEGMLEPRLNRWLPLVKWLLVIPHVIVLALLWLAFLVLTVVAGFAILFTERYPRGIFDFNVGVLRWTWRVLFYSYGALATDRYPPFSLAAADYPAALDIPYPERLSRTLVLVKWWLLAIPHYLVVGALAGGGWWWWSFFDWPGWWGGLIGALALVAAGGLVLFDRYPRGVFELIVGANRWVFRVIAYAALMRDEYPPFRLGR